MMAYFANSTEGMQLEEECASCPLGQKGCPIYIAQALYNYEACNNKLARAILNSLVEQGEDDPWPYLGCRMKPLLMALPESESET